MADMNKNAFSNATQIVGGVVKMARLLKVSSPTVSQWKNDGRPIPAARCPTVERATNGAVRCEDLRPDVDWAYLRGTAKPETPVDAA